MFLLTIVVTFQLHHCYVILCYLDVEEPDIRAVCVNKDASEPVSAMVTEPSAEITVNSEQLLEMPPGEGAVSRAPAQLPSDKPRDAAVSAADNATCELMDMDDAVDESQAAENGLLCCCFILSLT